jgi:preprotein translocase subunit SecE
MADNTSSITDKLKLAAALGLGVLGVAAYYWLGEDTPLVLRVLAVLAGLAAAMAVARLSAPGREFAAYAGDSVTEVKKVVWPTRKETLQTTAAVFAFVIVIAIFLWLTDKTLEWLLYELVLGWRKS